MAVDARLVERAWRAPGQAIRNGVRFPRSLTAGALDNARRSRDEIARTVAERRRLRDGLSRTQEPGDLTELDDTECLALLASRSLGRLAYVARAGVPDLVPVNYALQGRDVMMRSGAGPKLQAAQRRDVVAFEVDDIDEERRSGWSVVVVGRLLLVPPETVMPGWTPMPWASGPRRHLMRLQTRRITGRQLLGDPD